MNISPSELAILLIGAVLLTAVICYFILTQLRVSKSRFQSLHEESLLNRNNLEVEIGQKEMIQENLNELKSELDHVRERFESTNAVKIALQEKLDNTNDLLGIERNQAETLKNELRDKMEQIMNLSGELVQYRANLKNLEEQVENQKKDFEEIRRRSLDEFKVAANALLEEKSERFAKFNKVNIEQILKPLDDNLKEFKKQVSDTYDKEAKERFSLEGRIRELVDLNNQISKDAQNLTNALKGQAKTQGDWGEMILENILEFSGLTKNREYFVQDSFKDDEGNIKRPDVKVKYPDDRYIIIDSKVSLNAYERFTQTDEPDLMEIELAKHIQSIKNHIDDLSSKEYDKFDKTLDFVMLFVAVEPAYMLAMQTDPGLWNYAYGKRILLISPTNLIAALKMVSDIWKRDDQNKNAREIAKRGEMLYDKLVGFVNDLENIEKHISKADESWNDAMKKLKSGRGNLIGQAEKLRKLGLKPKNELPEAFQQEEE